MCTYAQCIFFRNGCFLKKDFRGWFFFFWHGVYIGLHLHILSFGSIFRQPAHKQICIFLGLIQGWDLFLLIYTVINRCYRTQSLIFGGNLSFLTSCRPETHYILRKWKIATRWWKVHSKSTLLKSRIARVKYFVGFLIFLLVFKVIPILFIIVVLLLTLLQMPPCPSSFPLHPGPCRQPMVAVATTFLGTWAGGSGFVSLLPG